MIMFLYMLILFLTALTIYLQGKCSLLANYNYYLCSIITILSLTTKKKKKIKHIDGKIYT